MSQKLNFLSRRNSGLIAVGLFLILVLSFSSNFYEQTIISISQIYVSPQGQQVGDEWTGSYWNIVASVSVNDALAGVVLPEGTEGSVTFGSVQEALTTGAKIELKIDPGTPYLIRGVQERSIIVAPAAEGTDSSVTSMILHYYGWSDNAGWRLVTPFTVSVYKDGSLVASKTLDMSGNNNVQTISTGEGEIRIENLGVLGSSYTGFETPTQICIFKGYANVYDYAQVFSMIDGNSVGTVIGDNAVRYSDYWYGVSRDEGVAFNPKAPAGVGLYTYLYNSLGGWEGTSSYTTPIKPVVSSSEKTSAMGTAMCLTEWLQYKNVVNLAASIFNTRASGNSASILQEASFVTDTNGETALKLTIPWGAYGTPIVNIRVPTELADTWVDQPVETNTDVLAVWESTSSTSHSISGSSRIKCVVTNTGTETGSARLTITSGHTKLGLTPTELTVNNLVPNVPQVVYFDAVNLGVTEQVSDVAITIRAYSTYTNTETDSCVLYGTLLPTLVEGSTTLTIRAVEKGTDTGIVGLQMQVLYPPNGESGSLNIFSGLNGYTNGLVLETPQGGAYTGQVFIQSADTTIYKPAMLTYTCSNPGVYEATLEVERKDMEYTSDDWIWLVCIAALAVAVAFLLMWKKRRHK